MRGKPAEERIRVEGSPIAYECHADDEHGTREEAEDDQRRVLEEPCKRRSRHRKTVPASMASVWPVTESDLQKSTIWRATSSSLVVRLRAACAVEAATRSGGTCANIRVPAMRPGATQLTVIAGA